jgi:hypothetical protein
VNALAPHDGGQRRRANFFRDTPRDPETSITHEALEAQALALVRASLEADALDNRRDLRPADMDRMLSAAKGRLRGMSERELRGISASSALLKTLTDYSLSAAPVTDLRSPAALAASAERDRADGVDGANGITARLLRADIERAERLASGARYDGLGGSERLSQSDLQNMASARSAAISLGMPWALNNPELLKLGAGAIKTLHEAGVQRERFERMVGDKVGFRAATAVDIAAFAKKHNLTPEQANALFDKINNGVEIISGGNKAIQRDLDEATRRYVTGPDTPEARKALEDSYRKHADTPEKREAAEATTKALQAAAQQTQADVAARNAKVAKAAEADTKNDDVIAGLNEPQPQKADAPKVDAKDVPAKAPAPQAQRAPAPK